MTADLAELLGSWELHLRGERKSPQTVKTYGDGVRRFLAFCAEANVPAVLDRRTVNAFVAALLEKGAEPATAASRQLALRRFSAWLVEEGEIPVDALAGMKRPKIDTKVIHPLSVPDLKAMLATCTGNDFVARRDEAVIRFMFETASRAGEVCALQLSDVDLRAGTAVIRRGKGGAGRVVPYGPQTARALDRYIRARKAQDRTGSDMLWLGERQRTFGYAGLYGMLQKRATAAGIVDFHPHRLRHTAAHRWLAAGGSESGLMAVAGWTRPDMLHRYTKAQASERAAEEARKLGLGDI